MKRVYRVSGDQGATFNWKIDGKTIHTNWVDSIEVEWNNVGVFNLEVEQINISGCRTYRSALVQVGAQPIISLGNTKNLCRGKDVLLDAGPGFIEYYWNNTKGSQTLRAINEGQYSVTAITAEGCVATASVNVSIVENPIVNLGDEFELCLDDEKVLDAGPIGLTYRWFGYEKSENTFTARVSDHDQYIKVKVTDSYGCFTIDSVLQKACDYSKFAQMIPNTFTPADDNTKNNTWDIPFIHTAFPNARIEIFDRWGQSVFLSNHGLPAEGWDGKRNGKFLPTDSYYYVIDLKNGSKPISGTVTIVR
jgi:gliding motility-associated-like protein